MMMSRANRSLTNLQQCGILDYTEQLFDSIGKGGVSMTDYEQELLYIIRSHDDPEQALEIAIKTIISFLELPESFQEPSVAYSLALA